METLNAGMSSGTALARSGMASYCSYSRYMAILMAYGVDQYNFRIPIAGRYVGDSAMVHAGAAGLLGNYAMCVLDANNPRAILNLSDNSEMLVSAAAGAGTVALIHGLPQLSMLPAVAKTPTAGLVIALGIVTMLERP
jgi:hypothetical protein